MKIDVIKKMKAFMPYLNEAQLRLYVASEARALGRGGKHFIENELGISHNTINKGIVELASSTPDTVTGSTGRERKKGGGRKKPSQIASGSRQSHLSCPIYAANRNHRFTGSAKVYAI